MDEMIPIPNIEAEKSTLGSMLIDQDALLDVLEILDIDDFYTEIHKEIFEAMKIMSLRNEPVDIITVSENVTGTDLAYLSGLTERAISGNAKHYANIVLEHSRRRKLIKAAQNIINYANDKASITDIIDKAEKDILSISDRKKQDYSTASQAIESALKQLEERCINKGKINGLPTGFADIDYKLGGLQDSDLIIIAGRPSMGKTALAENITTFVSCIKQLPVAFFSMEMKKEKIINRTISGWAMIDNSKMKLGTLEEDDWKKINEIHEHISGSKLIIDDTPHIKASEIRAKCRRIKKKMGDLRLIVVDHLTEMWRPGKGDDTGEHEENVRCMKRLASEMNCPVILLQQLNRGVEFRSDKRPNMSDLKETGAAEEVADVVMLLYRDDYYYPDSEKKNIAEVIIAKGRDVGTGTIELAWIGQYTKFANLEKYRGDAYEEPETKRANAAGAFKGRQQRTMRVVPYDSKR